MDRNEFENKVQSFLNGKLNETERLSFIQLLREDNLLKMDVDLEATIHLLVEKKQEWMDLKNRFNLDYKMGLEEDCIPDKSINGIVEMMNAAYNSDSEKLLKEELIDWDVIIKFLEDDKDELDTSNNIED